MKKLPVLFFLSLFAVSHAIADAADNTASNETLVQASKDGHAAAAKLLIDQGADVNAKDENGKPALMWASFNGHADVANLLIQKGADVNAKNKAGYTSLIEASLKGYADVAKLLIDKGADINARSDDGQTALKWASFNGLVDVVRQLIEKGADINAKDDSLTALMWASAQGHADVAKLLIEKGADVNAKGDDGRTALMWASDGGHEDLARLLIDKGAALDAKEINGLTALMLASQGGHEGVAKLLIEKGADVNAKDKNGKTARENAEQPTVKRSPHLMNRIVLILFSVIFVVSLMIRRKRHIGWKPNYVRVIMGWLIPAAIGWAIYDVALYVAPFIAFGNARAGVISSANHAGIVSAFGGFFMMGRLYIALSLAGCALSIIRYGDQEWIPYMKKTATVQLSTLALAAGGGLLGYLLLK